MHERRSPSITSLSEAPNGKRITVGRPFRSGLQMAVIGIVSALAGYFIGALFGAQPTP